mmetsp:Transcript_43302/g.106942  ORF Transcript_43302/g.106942 Transcript_43302/m.106942 type:complete len:383 (-) Transcript_43302:3635-4783(-)
MHPTPPRVRTPIGRAHHSSRASQLELTTGRSACTSMAWMAGRPPTERPTLPMASTRLATRLGRFSSGPGASLSASLMAQEPTRSNCYPASAWPLGESAARAQRRRVRASGRRWSRRTVRCSAAPESARTEATRRSSKSSVRFHWSRAHTRARREAAWAASRRAARQAGSAATARYSPRATRTPRAASACPTPSDCAWQRVGTRRSLCALAVPSAPTSSRRVNAPRAPSAGQAQCCLQNASHNGWITWVGSSQACPALTKFLSKKKKRAFKKRGFRSRRGLDPWRAGYARLARPTGLRNQHGFRRWLRWAASAGWHTSSHPLSSTGRSTHTPSTPPTTALPLREPPLPSPTEGRSGEVAGIRTRALSISPGANLGGQIFRLSG